MFLEVGEGEKLGGFVLIPFELAFAHNLDSIHPSIYLLLHFYYGAVETQEWHWQGSGKQIFWFPMNGRVTLPPQALWLDNTIIALSFLLRREPRKALSPPPQPLMMRLQFLSPGSGSWYIEINIPLILETCNPLIHLLLPVAASATGCRSWSAALMMVRRRTEKKKNQKCIYVKLSVEWRRFYSRLERDKKITTDRRR